MHENNNPPKPLKPNTLYLVAPVLCLAIYAPFLLGGTGIIFAFILLGLPILGLMTSYRAGYSLAKLFPKANAIILYIAAHAISIFLAFAMAMLMVGYPFETCFDTCTTIATPIAIFIFLIASAIIFAPGYYTLIMNLSSRKA